jgi:hypothetical protein
MPAVFATTIENRRIQRSYKKISSCFIIQEKIKFQFVLRINLPEHTFSLLNYLRLKGNHHTSSYPPARPVVTPISRQGFIIIQKYNFVSDVMGW